MAICLGTSLRIKPVGDMPLLALGQNYPEHLLEDDSDDDEPSATRPISSSEEDDDNADNDDACAGSSKRELVILNLQRTPLDKFATLRFHAECDEVMTHLMAELQLPLPSAQTAPVPV